MRKSNPQQAILEKISEEGEEKFTKKEKLDKIPPIASDRKNKMLSHQSEMAPVSGNHQLDDVVIPIKLRMAGERQVEAEDGSQAEVKHEPVAEKKIAGIEEEKKITAIEEEK